MSEKLSAALKDHGPLFTAVYWLFDGLRYVSLTCLWLKLGVGCGERFWDTKRQKTTHAWQDLGFVFVTGLIAVVVTILSVTSKDSCVATLISIVAVALLADMLIYYVNYLWFDDIQLEDGKNPRAWSFRRSALLAIVRFIESIFLFTVLYRNVADMQNKRFLDILLHSFKSATTLDFAEEFLGYSYKDGVPNAACGLWCGQIFLSIFFVVLFIAIVAAMGFKRDEIAGKKC